MNSALCILAFLGFGLLMALPKIFFRSDGTMNLRWWLTGSPFGCSMIGVALAWASMTPRLLGSGGRVGEVLDIAGMFFLVGSIALQAATMATNRVPLALWHQEGEQNAPKQIVTYGPYRYVRHPFYVSFLLLSIGSALIARDPVSIAAIPYAFIMLYVTTQMEEKKLLASSLGEEYGAYHAKTGRFFPRL